MRRRVLLSWSSGKDAAWTLKVLRDDPGVEVVGLLTTVNTTHERVAMHATRRALLEAQARAADLPLHVIPLPWPCPDEIYEREMRAAVESAREGGVTHVAFGDLFLEDVRDYRVRQLQGTGLEPIFPIWHEPTGPLARRIVDAGVEAFVTSVDSQKLPRSFAGRRFDHAFLDDLPRDVDPCGENGEFHTCVLAGPMFRGRIVAGAGEIVERDGFVFADIVPDEARTAAAEGTDDESLELRGVAGVDDIVTLLGLEPHPEGGFFRETFRSGDMVVTARGPRPAATGIFFLVTAEHPSLFHRLASEELWFYQGGSPLELVTLLPDGSAETVVLAGADALGAGEEVSPQAIVPSGAWQAARVLADGSSVGSVLDLWTLVSCVVVPGFDYADFALGERSELQTAYPLEAELIAALTRERRRA
jgi:uncharacterized protein (TIGR00290 family)